MLDSRIKSIEINQRICLTTCSKQTYNWIILLLKTFAIRFSTNAVYFSATPIPYFLGFLFFKALKQGKHFSYHCDTTYPKMLSTPQSTQRCSRLFNTQSQKGMGSFPSESGIWQQLPNQWVGFQGVYSNPTTGGTGWEPFLAPTEFLSTEHNTKLHRQTNVQAKHPFLLQVFIRI